MGKKSTFLADINSIRVNFEQILADGFGDNTYFLMNSCLYSAKESMESFLNSQERQCEDKKEELLYDMEKLLKIINKIKKKPYLEDEEYDKFQEQLENTINSMESYFELYNKINKK